jgi:beta-1,4-N-acetylglucosaminyltransferase
VLALADSANAQILGLSYTRIIYVESFTRVKSLSLSGKLLRPFVDRFVVQWPDAAGPLGLGSKAAVASPGVEVGKDDGLRREKRSRSGVTYRGWLV